MRFKWIDVIHAFCIGVMFALMLVQFDAGHWDRATITLLLIVINTLMFAHRNNRKSFF